MVGRPGRAPEALDFPRRQLAPVPELQPGIPNRSDADAPQLIHRVADRLAHLPNLPVSAFMHGDPQVTWPE